MPAKNAGVARVPSISLVLSVEVYFNTDSTSLPGLVRAAREGRDTRSGFTELIDPARSIPFDS